MHELSFTDARWTSDSSQGSHPESAKLKDKKEIHCRKEDEPTDGKAESSAAEDYDDYNHSLERKHKVKGAIDRKSSQELEA